MAGLTLVTATNELYGALAVPWKANAPGIVGAPVRWTYFIDAGAAPPVDGNKKPWQGVWARFTVLDQNGDSFAMGKRYGNTGAAYANIFVPPKPDAGTIALQLAAMLVAELRRHTGRVEFSRVRSVVVGDSGGLYQHNVLADYRWEQSNL